MPGTASIAWIGNPSGATLTIATSSTKKGTGLQNHSLVGVPAGAVLVASIAGENDVNNAVLGGSPVIVWTKQADAQASGSGDAEIWTAPATAGGSYSIDVSGISSGKNSSVIYAVTGQEAVLGGASNTGTGQLAPSVLLNTTRNNSIIFCVSSDFAARDGAVRTIRDSATETLYDGDSVTVNYTAYHYYKVTGASGAYTEGYSVPNNMSAGTAVYEIRTP